MVDKSKSDKKQLLKDIMEQCKSECIKKCEKKCLKQASKRSKKPKKPKIPKAPKGRKAALKLAAKNIKSTDQLYNKSGLNTFKLEQGMRERARLEAKAHDNKLLLEAAKKRKEESLKERESNYDMVKMALQSFLELQKQLRPQYSHTVSYEDISNMTEKQRDTIMKAVKMRQEGASREEITKLLKEQEITIYGKPEPESSASMGLLKEPGSSTDQPEPGSSESSLGKFTPYTEEGVIVERSPESRLMAALENKEMLRMFADMGDNNEKDYARIMSKKFKSDDDEMKLRRYRDMGIQKKYHDFVYAKFGLLEDKPTKRRKPAKSSSESSSESSEQSEYDSPPLAEEFEKEGSSGSSEPAYMMRFGSSSESAAESSSEPSEQEFEGDGFKPHSGSYTLLQFKKLIQNNPKLAKQMMKLRNFNNLYDKLSGSGIKVKGTSRGKGAENLLEFVNNLKCCPMCGTNGPELDIEIKCDG